MPIAEGSSPVVDNPRGTLPWGFYPKSVAVPSCRLLSQSGQDWAQRKKPECRWSLVVASVLVMDSSIMEVVPLNAGNVLGVEDSRPIPKWEAIIRRTLNKSLEPESIHKSYSAPPCPVLRTSSVADVFADDIDIRFNE